MKLKHTISLIQISPAWVSRIPQHWMPYLYVDSIDDSVAKAQKLGGRVIVPATVVEAL